MVTSKKKREKKKKSVAELVNGYSFGQSKMEDVVAFALVLYKMRL